MHLIGTEVVVSYKGVLWRLERDGERVEAVVAEREPGRLELMFLRNGELLWMRPEGVSMPSKRR